MIAVLHYLQIITAMSWFTAGVMWLPSLVRIWRSTASRLDIARAPLFFVAFVQTGQACRWLIWPEQIPDMGSNELVTWATLYTLSAGTAIYIIFNFKIADRLK